MAFCPSCGTQVGDGVAFCPSCGKPLGAAPATATAAAPAPAPVAPAASTGMSENVAGLLAYIVVVGIIFLLIEPYSRNRFIRFHCWQSIGLGVVWVAGHIILGLIPVIGWIISPFFFLAMLIVAIIAAVKAYQNQMWKLPIIGDFAEKQANS
jgi:uncharacterized membrane protein